MDNEFEDYKVNDDEWMIDHFGYTKTELAEMMMAGEDIGGIYDGDPIELLG